jgi:hypothetical protein
VYFATNDTALNPKPAKGTTPPPEGEAPLLAIYLGMATRRPVR